MYIRGRFPRIFAALVEAVPIAPIEDSEQPAYPCFLIGLQWTLYDGYNQGSGPAFLRRKAKTLVGLCGLILIISVRLCQHTPSLTERGFVDGYGCHTALNFRVKAKEFLDKVSTLY